MAEDVDNEDESWDPFRERPTSLKAGRYTLQGRIGAGGVAEVYRAIDNQLDRDCAVKLMEVPTGSRRAVGVRFLGEARVMSTLRHPNVPAVYDAGKEAGYYWFVMDYAAGGSVAQRVHQAGPMDVLEALDITFQVLQALAAVHELGLVHRDVKPENVLLDGGGRAMLADFGIARHPDGSVPVQTRPGELMGTRGYRAPEQEDDAHGALPTADLYGIAAMLFAMAVGRPPVRLWHEGRSTIPNFVDSDIRELIERGTHLDPEQRYDDARAMAVAVARAADLFGEARRLPPSADARMARFDALLVESRAHGRRAREKAEARAAAKASPAPPPAATWAERYLPGWAARWLG